MFSFISYIILGLMYLLLTVFCKTKLHFINYQQWISPVWSSSCLKIFNWTGGLSEMLTYYGVGGVYSAHTNHHFYKNMTAALKELSAVSSVYIFPSLSSAFHMALIGQSAHTWAVQVTFTKSLLHLTTHRHTYILFILHLCALSNIHIYTNTQWLHEEKLSLVTVLYPLSPLC